MTFPNLIKYALRDTVRSLSRHKGMAFVTIFTVMVTLFILGAVVLLTINGQYASKEIENELEIVVFLDQSIDADGINRTMDLIKTYPDVKNVTYVSRDAALDSMSGQFKSDINLRDSLAGSNPLPEAFRIKMENAESIQGTVKKLEALPEVDTVKYGEAIVQDVLTLSQSVRYFSAIVIAVMILATLFLINNTIGLTVANRKREIQIMRFVGATDGYVRMPFFFEGIILGLLGSVAAGGLLYFLYNKLFAYIERTVSFLPVMNDFHVILAVLGGMCGIGILLGALGSAVAVKKYLRN